MAVLKDLLDEPHHKSAGPPGFERETISDGHYVPGVSRLESPFVAPELHRAHRGLLNETVTGCKLQEGKVRVVNGDDPKEKHTTSKQAPSRVKIDIRQTANLSRYCHPKERPHLG